MDVGRGSARVVPERAVMPQEMVKAPSFKPKQRDLSQADSSSVTSAAEKPRKIFVLGEMRSKRMLTGSNSSFLGEGALTKRQKAWRRTQRRIAAFLDSRSVSIFMSVLTIFALFGDDLRIAVAPHSADIVFFNISFAILIAYVIELVLSCIAKPGYMWGFYFWLDLVSTLSLLTDVGWIWNALVGNGATSSASAVRAGRASRAGTRAGRIVRIVRLIRLIRVMKFFKQIEIVKAPDASTSAFRKGRRGTSGSDPLSRRGSVSIVEPSQVGKQLSDLTTRRVIFLVLFMVIVLPLLERTTFQFTLHTAESGLQPLHRMAALDPISDTFNATLRNYATVDLDMLYLKLHNVAPETVNEILNTGGYALGPMNDIQSLVSFRDIELIVALQTECYDTATNLINATSGCDSFAYFDNRLSSQQDGFFNIGKTLFVILLLAIGSVLFTTDSENLVIQPIERMVKTVMSLAEDPLGAVQETHVPDRPAKTGILARLGCSSKPTTLTYETDLLEKTIRRIAGLLQVGFGEAGAQVIAQNLKESKHGKLNPMVEGRKMRGVFGFCDIRQFTDATECLQEEVMVFVNRIAEIVHRATHKYAGGANKNIGDAFLLVWTINEADVSEHMRHGLAESEAQSEFILETQLTDNALYAFMKIVVDIENSNASGVLSKYAKNRKLLERFPQGFKVRMGFGLHHGWAIEGAIGSQFKVDASYLSPNVNISARLEAATKQYGVTMLLSGSFVEKLSQDAQSVCRKIDRITVKGSNQPLDLYTVDIYTVPPSFGCTCEDPLHFLDADFSTDPFVAQSQLNEPEGFREVFQRGLEAYLAGDWEAAHEELDVALHARPDDGPSKTLLNFMSELKFVCPRDWPGYRELTEK